jgi:hypothetical protein
MSTRFIPLEMNAMNAAFRLNNNNKKTFNNRNNSEFNAFPLGGGLQYADRVTYVIFIQRFILFTMFI